MVDYAQKTAYIAGFQEKIKKAKVVVLANCEGVNVEEMNDLRSEIRKIGDEIKVVKNTMLFRALKGLGKEDLGKHLVGATTMTFGYEDPVAPVKTMFDFSKKAKKFTFKAGMLGDKMLSVEDLEKLSQLPGRSTLLSMLLASMEGIIRNFVSVTQGPIRKLVHCVNAIKEKKEKEESAA